MMSIHSGKWIADHDMAATVDQITEGFAITDDAARLALGATVRCETCHGTGETPTGYSRYFGEADGACRTCRGAGKYTPLVIAGEAIRANLMDAYALLTIGVAEVDRVTLYRMAELV